jgi:glycosyltransferase involved in cell wall biosynthesis
LAKIKKILFLNQMAGPLFRELAEDLSIRMSCRSLMLTGHPDTLSLVSSAVKLKTIKAPVYNRRTKVTRVLSWLHYSLVAFWHLLKADKTTLVFLVSNPPFLGFFALLVQLFKKTRYIVLVYDIHPDTLISFGVLREGSYVARVWRLMNRLVWERSIAVYTLGSVMAENLTEQFDVKKTKLNRVGVIPPWADINVIKPIDKGKNPLEGVLAHEGKITVLYSGNMGISHDIDSILESARILKDEINIEFLLIGSGEKWQDAFDFLKNLGLKNLQVLPFQPESQLPYTMALADISLVSLDDGAEGLMVPSKMFYYMASGAAIIGICRGKNDVSEVIINSKCGLIIEPKNPKKLAAEILKLSRDIESLNQFKTNARKYSESDFSRYVCTDNFANEILPLIF